MSLSVKLYLGRRQSQAIIAHQLLYRNYFAEREGLVESWITVRGGRARRGRKEGEVGDRGGRGMARQLIAASGAPEGLVWRLEVGRAGVFDGEDGQVRYRRRTLKSKPRMM